MALLEEEARRTDVRRSVCAETDGGTQAARVLPHA
jgi:hypothetical protein